MYNDALNDLKADILAAPSEDRVHLKSLFDQHLERALACVVTSDYVEDCLFQIEEALGLFCTNAVESPNVRTYLLGAIEALRDELHLCDVEVDARKVAVGF